MLARLHSGVGFLSSYRKVCLLDDPTSTATEIACRTD